MTDVSSTSAGVPTATPAASPTPTAPPQTFKWARPFIPKRAQPYLRGFRKRMQFGRWRRLKQPFRTVYAYTQVHEVRQHSLLALCDQIERQNIPGAVVECGVLDGGTAALMAYGTCVSGRSVHLFDAWQGLPETSVEDGANAKVWTGEVVGSPARVTAVLRKLGVDLSRVNFHRGWFDQTFPTVDLPQIALLHIDADFYEPTKLCLQHWYPHLSPGGFIQIDDYDSFAGCRRAVDEFLLDHPELALDTRGRTTGARPCVIHRTSSVQAGDRG